MTIDFDEDFLQYWCDLYVRFGVKDRQRLAGVVNACSYKKLQRYYCQTPSIQDMTALLVKSQVTDADCLLAYGYLRTVDDLFWQKPHCSMLAGVIEKTLNDTRYILTRVAEHPMLKAIAENKRFKFEEALGVNGVLKLRHHWQGVERSTDINMRYSDVFDAYFESGKKAVKMGLSPFAGFGEMIWLHDPEDERGMDGCIPFWCAGAKNEAELLERLISVLVAAREQHVDILVFPELVMTEKLHWALSAWLVKHNGFEPILRLLVAGTRHVFDSSEENNYSNRCTVLNFIGDVEWEQDKRQRFDLPVEAAGNLLGLHAPAFEPMNLSQSVVLRCTALGALATPICLDFLCDAHWHTLPVDMFLVPVMSENLVRFKDQCREAGNSQRSAVFVCNALPDKGIEAVHAYRPAKETLLCVEENRYLFTIDIEIDMN